MSQLKKISKYVLWLIVAFIVSSNSVYFKKLSEVKAAKDKKFDAKAFALKYLHHDLNASLSKSIEVNELISLLKKDTDKAFKEYSNALSIGNIRYFMIKGQGKISSINDNEVSVSVRSDTTEQMVKIATEFVYGNAVRDASGIISITEFSNTTDLNNVSEEINNIIRDEIISVIRSSAKVGDEVQFYGAIELNQDHLRLDDIEAIPVSFKISK